MPKPNSWLPEQEVELLRLRNVAGVKWEEIAKVLGRSRTACQFRYSKIADPSALSKLGAWSSEEQASLSRLYFDERKTTREIAAIIGRSAKAVHGKLERMRNGPQLAHFERRTVIPEACLNDRNRRMAAVQDLTAVFFGDPAPGQSALDRKRFAEAAL